MINRIVDFSVHNRFLIVFLTAAAALAGFWSMRHMPLDAIPDISDPQVIIYSRWDRSPDVIEDQVTYPLVTAMLGGPRVKSVRGYSDFGYSYVYVVFEDNTDLYWARSRTLEYLSAVLPRLPQGVKTELGPDATGLGWVYQYVLEDTSGKHSLAEMRSYQDWNLRYHLKSVPGVADVAAVGGYVRQYQVNVDPNRLRAYGLPISRVVDAVRDGNGDAGGRLIEFGGTEYMVRGRGYARSISDFENIVVAPNESGAPVRIKDLGQVAMGPDLRRGVTDFNGNGEAVSGIVIMRQGENALGVIERVKDKIREIGPSLPEGIKLVPVYDRSELILRSVDNLKGTVLEIIITVALVILLFLWHFPSAVIPVITIPIAVLIAFVPFHWTGLSANILSLGGIAIAIGALVDAAIVVVEQVHRRLESVPEGRSEQAYRTTVIRSIKDVAGPSFFALLVLAVSFLPIATLEAQEGRLFRPLAYAKTFAMIVGAILAITFDPALRLLFARFQRFQFRPLWLCRLANALCAGKIYPQEKHPVTRGLIRLYEPVVRWSLRRPWLVFGLAGGLAMVTIPAYLALGTEWMPPLEEGTLLYMPSAMPGISLTEARKVVQVTDQIIRKFPEVDRVMGKAGRAESATDPAPLSMLETVITLRPKSEWRERQTWYSAWAPRWMKPLLRHVTSDRITEVELVEEMNRALAIPGLANAWTMPIRGRVDMLTTGIRTPVGLKISGPDLEVIEKIGARAETVLAGVTGARNVFSEHPATGYFLDIEWNREKLASYGLKLGDAQAAVQNAIGGENVTTTVEGRERYPVNVRYLNDFRTDIGAIEKVLVADAEGKRHIPLAELATVGARTGSSMVRNENGLLTSYVFVDLAGRDPNGYVKEAQSVVADKLKLPPGYTISWSGQYEAIRRMKDRLYLVVPLTVGLIFLLLYLSTWSVPKTLLILLAVPFSAIGAIWFLYLLGYNMSAGVWVGLIALLGIDAETGVFMLLYLDLAYQQAKVDGRLHNLSGLQEAIYQGAVTRIRPKFMTVAVMVLGLLPVMWATGTGSDVMKRIAAPMIGGIFTSFLLELVVYPPLYQLWKWHTELKQQAGFHYDESEQVAGVRH